MTYPCKKTAFPARALWLLLLSLVPAVCPADDYRSMQSLIHQAFPQEVEAVTESVQRAEAAGVAADSAALILSHAQQAELPAADFIDAMERVTKARSDGLPTAPFTEKILEGLAKNVPPALLIEVLDRKLATYQASKKIVDNATKLQEADAKAVTSLALAMERGVSAQALRSLYAEAVYGPSALTHSAQALADLESMGFTEPEGVEIANAGLRAGYLQSGATLIMQIVARAQKNGRTNQHITETLTAGFQRGMPLSEISMELRGGGAGSRFEGSRGGQGYGGPGGRGANGNSAGGGGGGGGGKHAQ